MLVGIVYAFVKYEMVIMLICVAGFVTWITAA